MAATCWSQKFRSDFSNCLLVFQKTEIRKAKNKQNMPVMENLLSIWQAALEKMATPCLQGDPKKCNIRILGSNLF